MADAPGLHWLANGNGDFDVEVVGTSVCRRDIADVARNPPGERAVVMALASLEREPSNAHDANAVAVKVGGRPIGHLRASLSRALASSWPMHGQRHCVLWAVASILGGLEVAGTQYAYTVCLDIDGDWQVRPFAPPAEFLISRGSGYSALHRTEDGSGFSAQVWLPQAAKHYQRPIEAHAFAGEGWSTVGIYIANDQRIGWGSKVFEIPRSAFESTLGPQTDLVHAQISEAVHRTATLTLTRAQSA